MDTTRKSAGYYLMVVLYIFLSFLSFYCACYRLPVGVKYAVNCVVAGLAVVAFLVKPDFARMKFCGKFCWMYFAPFLLFWLYSLIIWIVNFQTTDYIIRGTSNIVYMLTNILYICAAFYLFGKKSIYYTFYAMCLANIVVLLEVGRANGFGELFSQYTTLITSFAETTGPIIRKMELHDMVFGWGPYIIYFILCDEKRWKKLCYICAAVFFFTLGFKRIGVAAAVLAILIGLLIRRMRSVNKRRLYIIVSLVITALAFSYVVGIKNGTFFELVSRYGINLMGRETMYTAYNDYYRIALDFFGNGIRFIYNTGEANNTIVVIHNVYLELYIELGFIMWFFWMWYDLWYRTKWMAKNYSYKATVFFFAISVYIFILYATDNTYFYFTVNVAYRLLAMAWCYDMAVKQHFIKADNTADRERGITACGY